MGVGVWARGPGRAFLTVPKCREGVRSSETPRPCHLSPAAVRDGRTGVSWVAGRSPPARGPGHLGDSEARQPRFGPGGGSFLPGHRAGGTAVRHSEGLPRLGRWQLGLHIQPWAADEQLFREQCFPGFDTTPCDDAHGPCACCPPRTVAPATCGYQALELWLGDQGS